MSVQLKRLGYHWLTWKDDYERWEDEGTGRGGRIVLQGTMSEFANRINENEVKPDAAWTASRNHQNTDLELPLH
jgi:hypothetical protein